NVIMHADSGTGPGRWPADDGGTGETMADHLLFATERYGLPILQPLADALHARGERVHALLAGAAAGLALRGPVQPVDARGAAALRPRAVFSASNEVPTF